MWYDYICFCLLPTVKNSRKIRYFELFLVSFLLSSHFSLCVSVSKYKVVFHFVCAVHINSQTSQATEKVLEKHDEKTSAKSPSPLYLIIIVWIPRRYLFVFNCSLNSVLECRREVPGAFISNLSPTIALCTNLRFLFGRFDVPPQLIINTRINNERIPCRISTSARDNILDLSVKQQYLCE